MRPKFATFDEISLSCITEASPPDNLMFEVNSDGSVELTWTPPPSSPLGDTTGYRIYYTGASNGSAIINGGSTNSYTLMGLMSGKMYEISIVGTSVHFPSEAAMWETVTVIAGELFVESKV